MPLIHCLQALETIEHLLHGKVDLKHIIHILLGKATQEVKAYKHNLFEYFGKGKEKGENYWKTLIRYGQINNLIH